MSQMDDHAEMRSVTKSVMATLVGAALREGRLPSLDAKLGDLLPQHGSIMDAHTERITVPQPLSQPLGIPRDRLTTSILIAPSCCQARSTSALATLGMRAR